MTIFLSTGFTETFKILKIGHQSLNTMKQASFKEL